MRRPITTLLLCLLLSACAHSDLRMTVMFDDPQGLSVGNDVRIGKERVGEVTGLNEADGAVAVDLRIEQKHRARVTDDSSFEVERRALLSSEKVLSIDPGQGEPVSQGARVHGQAPLMARLSGWAKSVVAVIKNAELRERLSDFRDEVKRAAEKGRDGFADARPALEEEAEKLIEMARGEGDEVADRLQKMLKELLDDMADQLDG